MDSTAFLDELSARFGGDLFAAHPVDRRFEGVVDAIPGMTTEHSLTLLNLAVQRMPADQAYLEVGSYRGRSLVGAMLGNPSRRAVAIESFTEFGADPEEGERLVQQSLAEFGCEDRTTFVAAEAFHVLRPGLLDRPVGVYFYDGAHSRVAQYLGLALAEPLLADEAIVVVDDTSWPQVAAATARYISRHPGYRVLADLAADRDFDPRWCNGVTVLQWRRPAGWKPPGGMDILWRRVAHRYLLEPPRRIAWRVLPRHPRLMALAKKLYLHGGTSVTPETSGPAAG